MSKIYFLRKLVLIRQYTGAHEQDIIGTLCFIAGMGITAIILLILGLILQ